jgi:HEAT repeat protein
VIGLVIAFAIPTSHYWLIGVLQNEAFYNGKPTSYWVSALKKQGYFELGEPPRDVGKFLADAGTAAAPVLADMLQEDDDEVRAQAVLALNALKPGEGAAAASALERTLMNEEACFNLTLASWALVKADQQAAVRAFIGVLERGRTAKNRVQAATALGDLGQRARAAVEPLQIALDNENREVRVAAAQALWRIERRANTKLLLTLAQSGEESPSCGQFSAGVWEDLGPKAQAAVPGLFQALQDADDTLRLRATIAVGSLGQSIPANKAVRALAARLKDGSSAVRRAAACALRNMGPKASEAVPALIETLHDSDEWTRFAAVMALGEIGPLAAAAAPHLARAVKGAEVDLPNAAYVLGRIGPAAKAVVPDLIEALKDNNEYIRDTAAEALGRIGPAASAAIPGLIAALTDESVLVPRSAANALAQIALAQVQVP